MWMLLVLVCVVCVGVVVCCCVFCCVFVVSCGYLSFVVVVRGVFVVVVRVGGVVWFGPPSAGPLPG